MVEAIDFSALEYLSFSNSSFCLDALKILVERISDIADLELPLATLDLSNTDVSWYSERVDVKEQLERLKMLIPFAKIRSLKVFRFE